MNLQRETLQTAWDEIKQLWLTHNDEVGALDNEKFSPDGNQYLSIEDAGYLHLYTMRMDGELVGYCTMFVTKHHHYPNTLWAKQDVLYVVPEWRGFAAYKFMRFIDRELKTAGVNYIVRQVTSKKNFSRTLERMGYEAAEVNYLRRM